MSENTAPIVINPEPNWVVEGRFNFIFLLWAVFDDRDPGDHLLISATLEDGSPLPDWIIFLPDTQILFIPENFSGVGSYTVKLTATDTFGAQASDFFDLDVRGPNLTINGTPG